MNLELFITQRIAFSKSSSFSGFIVKIAIAAIALSMTVMIITTAIVSGFQNEIRNKIFGFWGHIHITSFDSNNSYEDINPISQNQLFYPDTKNTSKDIKHLQVFAHKAGIIKTDNDIEGIVLKGISSDFDWSFFSRYLVSGTTFNVNDTAASKCILLSQSTAKRLQIKVNDDIVMYFVQQPPRIRKFTVCGIYNTNLEEYDEKYALIDIRHIQKLNNWAEGMVGGFEVFLKSEKNLTQISDSIYANISNSLYAQNIREINPNIFEWLELQDMNKTVILTLMLIVAIINMITALLILILERTNMIGILKALGASNWRIRKIFIYNALIIVSIGLLIGNVLGIGLCLIQKHAQIITLPQESYYLTVAPIEINLATIIGLNVFSFITCLLMLILPSYLVTRILPIKAIRFA